MGTHGPLEGRMNKKMPPGDLSKNSASKDGDRITCVGDIPNIRRYGVIRSVIRSPPLNGDYRRREQMESARRHSKQPLLTTG